jgi:hypothetical protein
MNIHRLYQAISPRFRRRRMQHFFARLNVGPQDRLLDIGGYPWCWTEVGRASGVTLLNLSFPEHVAASAPAFSYVTGDGCALPFAGGQFEVLFSNSVIEHVGTWERQQQFAAEARRVGRRLWVQTPAREFFIEPHLITPFIHWLPVHWRRRLLRNFTVWGWMTRPSPDAVAAFLAEVRLLTREDMGRLFPDCQILEEKFLGLTKSYIAVRTAEPAPSCSGGQ